MILEKISVRGYLGIRSMDLPLDRVNAFIGENGWGKSSLFNLLSRVFGDGPVPCRFTAADFYIDEDTGESLGEMQFRFSFRERRPGQARRAQCLAAFDRYWIRGAPGDCARIIYGISAVRGRRGIQVRHCFYTAAGTPMKTSRRDIIRFVSLNPVFRIRDSRMDRGSGQIPWRNEWERKIAVLARKLSEQDTELPGIDRSTLEEGLEALSFLAGSYIPDLREPRSSRGRSARDIASRPLSLAGMGTLQSLMHNATRTMKLILVVFQDALLKARGGRRIPRICFPILILTDLESRLHPSYLMMFISMLEQVGVQKLIATNSGDLLSCLGLVDVRRMSRDPRGCVSCRSMNERLFSTDDIRRLTSHVRLTRPVSLFARVWLLVEGETEIWLILQLAALAGRNLQGEGIRLIEFAQCGAGPLIALARQFGISWHLLCDGDDAGARYAATAAAMLSPGQQLSRHLTRLPEADIEHYLYVTGFEGVYRRESGYGDTQGVPVNKIIERAVHRRSKPGLAINVVEAADRMGPEGIPPLLMDMFRILEELSGDPEL